ncbi:DUF3368 domain-containing protein [Candidatus Magnetomoraceae bacterium gMMP-15]
MIKIVVADAGPLIGLARVDHLSFIKKLYGSVLIPPEVLEELKIHSDKPGAKLISKAIHADWIKVTEIKSKEKLDIFNLAIDAGEAEAIQLAIEQHANLLLIDDRKGRNAARNFGLKIIGTGGLLINAKKAGLLIKVSPILKSLEDVGYRLSSALCERIVELANEK